MPVKKPPPGSLAVNTVGTPTTSGVPSSGSTPNIFAAATATPKSMINTTGELYLDTKYMLESSTERNLVVLRVRQVPPTPPPPHPRLRRAL